jgi:hypothetical protein
VSGTLGYQSMTALLDSLEDCPSRALDLDYHLLNKRKALGIELLVLTLDHPASDTRQKKSSLKFSDAGASERTPSPRQKPTLVRDSQFDIWELIDPFTERELEILHSIADDLLQHEIASLSFTPSSGGKVCPNEIAVQTGQG